MLTPEHPNRTVVRITRGPTCLQACVSSPQPTTTCLFATVCPSSETTAPRSVSDVLVTLYETNHGVDTSIGICLFVAPLRGGADVVRRLVWRLSTVAAPLRLPSETRSESGRLPMMIQP